MERELGGAMKCCLGIDPGISGGFAFYWTDFPGRVSAYDMPTVNGQVDAVTFADQIRQMRPDMAIIERVGAMPKQGVSSTFKFGMACGIIHGVVASLTIPIHLVHPTVWKKSLKLSSDKEQSRALALRIFPDSASHFSRKKDHNRAEAALLARYGSTL